MSTIALCPVEWFVEADPHDMFGMPYYRPCDICYESASDDAMAGKSVDDFRKFWKEFGPDSDGLSVCENCIEAYLAEPG